MTNAVKNPQVKFDAQALIVSLRALGTSRKETISRIISEMEVGPRTAKYYVDRAFPAHRKAKPVLEVVQSPPVLKWTIRDSNRPDFILEVHDTRAAARASVVNYKAIWTDTKFAITQELVHM